jgi:hypothetical protein
MQVHQTSNDTYTIRRQGDLYIFSEIDGVDIFYYNCNSCKYGFPHEISINPDLFDDKFVYYVYKRARRAENESKIVKYLWLLFNRLLKYPLFHYYKIDSRILDKYGKIDHALHLYYIRNFNSINDYPLRHLNIDLPYTKNTSSFIFSFMEQEIDNYFIYDLVKISRKIFEYSLTNLELKKAYVEIYAEENEFYYIRNSNIKTMDNITIYGIYFVFTNRKLSLIYFK